MGEIRPLHVDACQPGAAVGAGVMETLSYGKRLGKRFVGQGHGSRGKGGNTALRQIAGHGTEPIIVGVGKIRAHGTVDVEIHKAGQDCRTGQINAVLFGNKIQKLGEAAVFHPEAAVNKLPFGGKDTGVFVKHGRPSHESFMGIFCHSGCVFARGSAVEDGEML